MVRQHDNATLDSQYGQFEQIIYKKQVDLKGPVTEFNGTLKHYIKSNKTIRLNLSTTTTLFVRNHIRTTHA